MTIQDDIERKKTELRALESQQQQHACLHEWNPIQYVPRVIAGGGRPSLGSHRPSEYWVDQRTFPRWSRCCSRCGIVQFTETTKPRTIPGSIPGTTGTENVPDFGEDRRPTMRIPGT